MDGCLSWPARAVRIATLSVVVWVAGGFLSSVSAAAQEPAQVTFSGFQRGRSGDGTLFVHMSERTETSVRAEGNRVTIRIQGATIDVRNNRHPLDLRHFEVLLLESRLVQDGSDVELRLELRRPAELDVKWVPRNDGLVSLHVAIPPA